jgi:hypothetical protein
VPYRGVAVVGVIVSVTPRRALFFVGGQLRRSRSAQAVSDAQITNRIRLLRIMVPAQHLPQLKIPDYQH